MIEKYCCFTGLRPQKFTFNEQSQKFKGIMKKCENLLIQLIEKYNVTHFISGMALGWDTWCAIKVLELKKTYPQISLECVIPCNGQEKYWSDKEKIRYYNILGKSDKIVTLQEHYTNDCMMKRNKYIVNNSLYVLALWDGQNGGTSQTVQYAIQNHRRIIIINPINEKIKIKA